MGIIAFAPSAVFAALGVAVMGLGMGPSMPNYTTYWMATVPPALRGRAAGTLTSAFFGGQFASPLVTAPLVGIFGLNGAFEALSVFMILLGAGLWALARREARQEAAA